MSDVTIYHNPDCGTSRNTLGLIRNAGIEPTVIEYLRDPPSREALRAMIDAAGLSVRQALREKGTPYQELGLSNEALTNDQLLDAMMAHPILINRPFVVTRLGVRLCRPSEVVLEILPALQSGPFTKEDGEVVFQRRSEALELRAYTLCECGAMFFDEGSRRAACRQPTPDGLSCELPLLGGDHDAFISR